MQKYYLLLLYLLFVSHFEPINCLKMKHLETLILKLAIVSFCAVNALNILLTFFYATFTRLVSTLDFNTNYTFRKAYYNISLYKIKTKKYLC